MRAALNAITDELKRLKNAGVKSVVVSAEGLAALGKIVHARAARAALQKPAVPATAAKPMPNPVATAMHSSEAVGAAEKPSAPAPRYETPAASFTVKPLVSAADRDFPSPPSVALPEGDKQTRWDALRQLVLNDPVCRAQVTPNKKAVMGVGNLDARIFFCGDAPGPEEEAQGEPFVGPAGQLLNKMILAMGLKREEVYVGSFINWTLKPAAGQKSRSPMAGEMAYGLAYLKAQIALVNPEVIVALGSTVAQGLFGTDAFKTLGDIRGQWKQFAEKPVMVTYHPSYILNTLSNRSKRAIWEDLLKVMERASLPISDKQRNFFLEK